MAQFVWLGIWLSFGSFLTSYPSQHSSCPPPSCTQPTLYPPTQPPTTPLPQSSPTTMGITFRCGSRKGNRDEGETSLLVEALRASQPTSRRCMAPSRMCLFRTYDRANPLIGCISPTSQHQQEMKTHLAPHTRGCISLGVQPLVAVNLILGFRPLLGWLLTVIGDGIALSEQRQQPDENAGKNLHMHLGHLSVLVFAEPFNTCS